MSYTHRQFRNQLPPAVPTLPIQGTPPSVNWVGPSGKKLGYTPSRGEIDSGSARLYNPQGLNRSPPAPQVGDILGAGATALGSASLVAPALAPVAAGLGVGYGLYKIGEGLKLW
jgi:hypothetical protein